MPDFSMFDLSGKVAVVTGGNGGIGLGLARGLAKAGAKVSVWARNEAKCEVAKKELEALGAEIQTVSCDVSDEAAVVSAVATTLDTTID